MNFEALKMFAELQRRIHSHAGPSARIAGGCPRNVYFGLPVKDIDVLVETEAQVAQVCAALNVSVMRPPLACDEDGESYHGSHDLDSSENLKVYKCSEWCQTGGSLSGIIGYSVDILLVPHTQKRIELFPDYISQMWFTTRESITYTTNCWSDISNRCIRYRGERMRPPRLARLHELFDPLGFKFKDLDAIQITSSGRSKRDPDETPFWWETPSHETLGDAAMRAVHHFSEMMK